jgi:hypothetical protein
MNVLKILIFIIIQHQFFKVKLKKSLLYKRLSSSKPILKEIELVKLSGYA